MKKLKVESPNADQVVAFLKAARSCERKNGKNTNHELPGIHIRGALGYPRLVASLLDPTGHQTEDTLSR